MIKPPKFLQIFKKTKPIWARFCEAEGQARSSCEVGWGSQGGEGSRSCFDLPIEDNCRNLVVVPKK